MNKQLETLQTELANGEPQLQVLLQGLHRLDRYAWRMHLLKQQDSMLKHLQQGDSAIDEANETVSQENTGHEQQGLLTSLTEMIDRLEQHVSWVMQAMNRWCLSVLAWEVGIMAVVAMLVAGIAAVIGQGNPLPVLQGWWAELLARPVTLTVYTVLLVAIAAMVHFRLRKMVAAQIVAELQQEKPFDTQQAFLKNTRIWHSIYRPQPVGWANRAENQLHELRRELTDKFAHQEAGRLH